MILNDKMMSNFIVIIETYDVDCYLQSMKWIECSHTNMGLSLLIRDHLSTSCKHLRGCYMIGIYACYIICMTKHISDHMIK